MDENKREFVCIWFLAWCPLFLLFSHRKFEEDFQVQGQASALEWDVMYPDEEYIFGDFTERLWAYLTIQQLLELRSV